MQAEANRRWVTAGWLVAVLSVAGCVGASDDRTAPPVVGESTRWAYGDHDDAFGELWLPEGDAPAPVVVLIHGGFWRDGFFLDLMDPLIPSLLERGVAVWNIEYRRVGAGGGYPETFEDVADAMDLLAALPNATRSLLDLDRVGLVGHSAGGHLAVWGAARPALAPDEVGADPMVSATLAVSQAGVLDLAGCVEQGIGGTACVDIVSDPSRHDATSPAAMVPFAARVVAVHGTLDRIVPASQSITFVERAQSSGMDATYVPVDGADHFSNLDPGHPAWMAVLDVIDAEL